MKYEKSVDESWKESAAQEKEHLHHKEQAVEPPSSAQNHEEPAQPTKAQESPAAPEDSAYNHSAHEEGDVDFLNYVSSLGYQAMIFLGLIPNPMTNEIDQNLQQAKFLIDTLSMLRIKTKGNLTKQEENVLNATVYELQMKFIDLTKGGEAEGAQE